MEKERDIKRRGQREKGAEKYEKEGGEKRETEDGETE